MGIWVFSVKGGIFHDPLFLWGLQELYYALLPSLDGKQKLLCLLLLLPNHLTSLLKRLATLNATCLAVRSFCASVCPHHLLRMWFIKRIQIKATFTTRNCLQNIITLVKNLSLYYKVAFSTKILIPLSENQEMCLKRLNI